jgi:hypothetical protein
MRLTGCVQRRDDAERKACQKRDDEREGDDGAIDANFGKSWQIRRLCRDERAGRNVGNAQPDDGSAQPQENRLGDELTKDPPVTRSEC